MKSRGPQVDRNDRKPQGSQVLSSNQCYKQDSNIHQYGPPAENSFAEVKCNNSHPDKHSGLENHASESQSSNFNQ